MSVHNNFCQENEILFYYQNDWKSYLIAHTNLPGRRGSCSIRLQRLVVLSHGFCTFVRFILKRIWMQFLWPDWWSVCINHISNCEFWNIYHLLLIANSIFVGQRKVCYRYIWLNIKYISMAYPPFLVANKQKNQKNNLIIPECTNTHWALNNVSEYSHCVIMGL